MVFPVWYPGITRKESFYIERVQRTTLAIILAENHTTYSKGLTNLGLDKLEDRREKLCLNFAKRKQFVA